MVATFGNRDVVAKLFVSFVLIVVETIGGASVTTSLETFVDDVTTLFDDVLFTAPLLEGVFNPFCKVVVVFTSVVIPVCGKVVVTFTSMLAPPATCVVLSEDNVVFTFTPKVELVVSFSGDPGFDSLSILLLLISAEIERKWYLTITFTLVFKIT